jgi:hypothetical protein
LDGLLRPLHVYDEDDKFVDNIGEVPIKPGTHRFVGQA